MTEKQYLKQAHRLNDLIQTDLDELKRLRMLSTCVSSPNYSGMPSGGSGNTDPPFVRCIEKIIDLEKEIESEVAKFTALNKEIRDAINEVQDANQKFLLKLRYIEFLTWEQIAENMNYSIVQVHRIHAEALKNVKIPNHDM